MTTRYRYLPAAVWPCPRRRLQRALAFFLLGVGLVFACIGQACASLKAKDVPLFEWRARVLSSAGNKPEGKTFSFKFGRAGKALTAEDEAWSEWGRFGAEQAKEYTGPHAYPNTHMRGYPLVTKLQIGGISEPAVVNVEIRFDGSDTAVELEGDLYGGALGILFSKDRDGKPGAATMAQYNRKYWKALAGMEVTVGERPKKFPIVDRFITGDSDRLALREGIHTLANAGFSAIMLPPDNRQRECLLETGNRRTAWAVYNPPGYAFDFSDKITPESIEAWAVDLAKPYLNVGYAAEDMAIYAMSDEPGWYYPATFNSLKKSEEGMQRFHDYLRNQGLKPKDLGAKRWEEVLPLGRSKAVNLPARRLFYWTMRFFPWDSARHFAECTRAMEKAFYPKLPVLVNWNFFSGRFYVPGPVANNSDKKNPDAAMGGHDWLEFGRMRGCTMLWTEDWFGDGQAYQWSYYCARLRSAAETGGVEFGGYVIPRTAGQRKDGILQKIITVVGSGGKAIKYFVFGPEYNFPGNCYSENIRVLPKMAEAHRMIGKAEDLLWPGRMPKSPVAILMPRSAQVWDAKDIKIPHQIRDATNTSLNRNTVDYMAETFNLYLALQHANIPVRIVEEDDLTPQGLSNIRVLYVTEPNIPDEYAKGVVRWVNAGGTLVTVSGAGQFDRYDEPSRILEKETGIREEPRQRLLISSLDQLKIAGKGEGQCGDFEAVGVCGKIINPKKLTILGTFENGEPAIVSRNIRKGNVYHFAWMPGLSYGRSSKGSKDGLPVDWSATIRGWIVLPVHDAGIEPAVGVNVPLVETPLLVSEAGAVVTILNWTGQALENLEVNVRLPFAPTSVESVKHGPIKFTTSNNRLNFSLPAGSADFVMIRK